MDYSAASGTPLTAQRFLDQYGHSALTIRDTDSIIDAASHFHASVGGKKYSVAVVLDDNFLVVGVLSLGDIVFAIHQHMEKIFTMSVADIMAKQIHAAKLSDDIVSLLKRMAELDIRHMPVVENRVLKGLITRKDALEGLYDDAALELKSLTQFVFRSDARY
ncbi:MAG: CBS domain-containing protein [Rhodospirillaceae bacterium]